MHKSWKSVQTLKASVIQFFCHSLLNIRLFSNLASGVPCVQTLTTANAHTKDQEGDHSKLSKEGEHGKPRIPADAQSNIFVLRKMVEEVFTVLYSKESPKLFVFFMGQNLAIWFDMW